jgi:hypothetical protein
MTEEYSLEPSGAGAVVLDIGGAVGAAIVHAPPSLAGAEVEIRPAGMSWDGRHVAVRPRRLPGGLVYAALFDRLSPGWHEVRIRDCAQSESGLESGPESGPEERFLVIGGRVTEARL